MAYKQAIQVAALLAVQSSDGNEAIPIVGDYVIPAGLVNGDIVEMCALPAGYVPVDAILAAEDCDSTAAMSLDVGVLSGDYGVVSDARTMGNEFIAASTVAQAGGLARCAKAQALLLAPSEGTTRGVGVKFVAVGTPIVGAKLRLTLLARPALNGV